MQHSIKYALHLVTIGKYGSQKAYITDNFDFEFDIEYSNIMSSAINNWGWLRQNMGVLKPIKINIEFYL